jgi:hypothetical protein
LLHYLHERPAGAGTQDALGLNAHYQSVLAYRERYGVE